MLVLAAWQSQLRAFGSLFFTGPQPPSRRSGESSKLQQHLELLREQYVKLQQRHSELEQKYSHAVSTSGSVGPDHYVSRLLNLIADLYDKSLYR